MICVRGYLVFLKHVGENNFGIAREISFPGRHITKNVTTQSEWRPTTNLNLILSADLLSKLTLILEL
jgi:hypothetical protein